MSLVDILKRLLSIGPVEGKDGSTIEKVGSAYVITEDGVETTLPERNLGKVVDTYVSEDEDANSK